MQCLMPALWALAFLGLQRNGFAGRVTAIVLVLVNAWVAAATYLLKLIPMYGGFTGRSTPGAVFAWWHSLPLTALSMTLLGPLWLVFASLTVMLSALVATTIVVLRRLRIPLAAAAEIN